MHFVLEDNEFSSIVSRLVVFNTCMLMIWLKHLPPPTSSHYLLQLGALATCLFVSDTISAQVSILAIAIGIWAVDPINGQYLQYSVKPPVSTKPFGRAGRSIGLVEFQEWCAVKELNTGARGSSKKTGTEFTWSCESDATPPLRSRYWFPLSGWETLRRRIGLFDIQLTCLAVLLASYLFTLGSALTWGRHCVTQLCDFQQNYFKPSCSLLLGGCFMWGWGSEQWYEIPGFAEQPIWS